METNNTNDEYVYLDAETTGLDPDGDEVLEVAIINNDGYPLVNTLIKPIKNQFWPTAENIHGITPEMVVHAPLLSDVANDIKSAVAGKDVIIYNAHFDADFLGELLATARSIQCCMLAWAKHRKVWSDYHGNYRWYSLSSAARAVQFEWPDNAHRAFSDSLACRAVWQYLIDPQERQRIDAKWEAERQQREAKLQLYLQERQKKEQDTRRAEQMNQFIRHWWLGLYGGDLHWSKQYCKKDEIIENEFSLIFFNQSLYALHLEDTFSIIYRSKKDIPIHLKPASFFLRERWFQEKLEPCAAYIGKKQAWPLYDITEKEKIEQCYPLRFCGQPTLAANEKLLTKTELKKHGLSDAEIQTLTPVLERQNMYNQEWYYLYKI